MFFIYLAIAIKKLPAILLACSPFLDLIMLRGKETSDFGIIATQSSYFWLPNMIEAYKTSASHWLEQRLEEKVLGYYAYVQFIWP